MVSAEPVRVAGLRLAAGRGIDGGGIVVLRGLPFLAVFGHPTGRAADELFWCICSATRDLSPPGRDRQALGGIAEIRRQPCTRHEGPIPGQDRAGHGRLQWHRPRDRHAALACGCTVGIMARDGERLQAAKADIVASCPWSSGTVSVLQADVSDEAGVAAAMARFEATCGLPDFLFNCAGTAEPGYIQDLSAGCLQRRRYASTTWVP